MFISRPSAVLVQNPPSVPMLPVTWLACKVKRCDLIVDWHNYGHSILALNLGTNNFLVRMSKVIEENFGRRAFANLCVTEAMKSDLQKNWKISATVLYDRPASIFRPAPLPDRHALFMRLREHYPVLASTGPDTNLITERFADGRVHLRQDRPGLIVSSTSWTKDENFDLLLDALEFYNEQRNNDSNKYPPLLVVITGKGPLKADYEALIMLKDWQNVEVCTVWLETEDYPKLLASADLGVCLHTSSSGLDLPMKVVDMFGCGLPVFAYKFPCIGELVKHGENGLVFETCQELGYQIANWFEGFPEKSPSEYYFRQNLESFQKVRWHDNWMKNALPILTNSSKTS
ncbi:hypothetical protein QYM36_008297 [Artemia franciscana]|nr:hypothetical protein QYM36_008297 [Artemia franciscana]